MLQTIGSSFSSSRVSTFPTFNFFRVCVPCFIDSPFCIESAFQLLCPVTFALGLFIMQWDPWADPWRPSQLNDPPLAVVPPDDSSDEDNIPPPNHVTGLNKQLAMTMTVHQLAESLFGADSLEPGFLRALNHAGETVHGTTQIGHLMVPRMLYFQTGSDVQFRHI